MPKTIIPDWLHHCLEKTNSPNAIAALQDSACIIGSPIIHEAHSGAIECPYPGFPVKYYGYLEGNAAVIDARGNIIARHKAEDGEGVVCADISLGSQMPDIDIPKRYWLRKRGFVAAFAWHHQRWLGRSWYAHNVRGNTER